MNKLVQGGKLMEKGGKPMNKLVLGMIFGLLLLGSSVHAFGSDAQPQMFLQTESPATLRETVKVFREEVAAGGWSILNVTNMAGILSAKGFTLAPVLIFDV